MAVSAAEEGKQSKQAEQEGHHQAEIFSGSAPPDQSLGAGGSFGEGQGKYPSTTAPAPSAPPSSRARRHSARADEGYHGLRLACKIRQRGFLKVVSIAGQREEGAGLARYPLPFSGEGVESIPGVAYTDRFAIHPCAALSRSESSVPAIRYSFLSCANLSSVNRG